jgi:hypothetical protein
MADGQLFSLRPLFQTGFLSRVNMETENHLTFLMKTTEFTFVASSDDASLVRFFDGGLEC